MTRVQPNSPKEEGFNAHRFGVREVVALQSTDHFTDPRTFRPEQPGFELSETAARRDPKHSAGPRPHRMTRADLEVDIVHGCAPPKANSTEWSLRRLLNRPGGSAQSIPSTVFILSSGFGSRGRVTIQRGSMQTISDQTELTHQRPVNRIIFEDLLTKEFLPGVPALLSCLYPHPPIFLLSHRPFAPFP